MTLSRVDGLLVRTPSRIPGLPAARRGRADWTVAIDRGDPEERETTGVAWTGHVRDAARRWCRYGRRGDRVRVLVERWFDLEVEPARRRATLRHALGRRGDARVLRRALPYLAAMSSGRLALHAAGAVFPEGAVLFCADSRTGKSTLALALDAAGVPVLGDDHVVVDLGTDGRPWARPSVPWVEVGDRSVRRFRPDARARSAGDEVVRLRTRRPEHGAPVAATVFLRRGTAVGFRRRAGRAALPRLLRSFAFVGDPVDDAEQAERFDLAWRLVSSAEVGSLTLPEGLARLARYLPRLATGRNPRSGRVAEVKRL